MDDIFNGLECRTSLDSHRTANDFFDDAGSFSSDSTDAESCISTESVSECIGAMWSEDDIKDEIRQLWSKQLRDAMEKFDRPKDGLLSSSEAWKASLQWLVSHVNAGTDMSHPSSDVSSVRKRKAVIEMTVFVGGSCKPTINVINRQPNPPAASEPDEEIIFSVDRL